MLSAYKEQKHFSKPALLLKCKRGGAEMHRYGKVENKCMARNMSQSEKAEVTLVVNSYFLYDNWRT